MKNKVALHNLGCKVNSYEIDSMKEQLIRSGYEIVPFKEGADIYIINTCTVTNIADRKSRQMLHKAKKLNPKSIVIATGCYAQSSKDEIDKDEAIDFVLGNNYKGKIVEAIEEYVKNNSNIEYFSDINLEKEFEDISISNISGHVRAYIKIQDGCNRFCSYCIIPYVRGRVRSREIDSIYKEIYDLSNNGIMEVVLTGIQLSAYGYDFKNGKNNLIEVVKKISDIDNILRIRFGSLEPNIVDEDFVKELSKIKKVCPHFHLSLQSGSDSVLKRMNRHYDTDKYMDSCNLLRKYFNNPAITTDIIVGFPEETEEEFEQTCDYIRKISLAQTHIFKYSKRKGTRAANMNGQIDEIVKTSRAERLKKITDNLEIDYLKKFVNKNDEVILEEDYIVIDGNEYTIGHNKRYAKIAVLGKYEKNNLMNVYIEDFDKNKKLLIARRRDYDR